MFLYEQVARRGAAMIDCGTLAADTRVPSVRPAPADPPLPPDRAYVQSPQYIYGPSIFDRIGAWFGSVSQLATRARMSPGRLAASWSGDAGGAGCAEPLRAGASERITVASGPVFS